MTSDLDASPQLEKWASVAGYSLTQASLAHDGRTLFWSQGGMQRFYVGNNGTGWYLITGSDRFGPEQFVLAARSMVTIERYFFGNFGQNIRSHRKLPRVRALISESDVAVGYSIGMSMFDHMERFSLSRSDGSVIAISSSDKLTGTMELAELSLYLSASVHDIMASSTDPEGKPLFVLQN